MISSLILQYACMVCFFYKISAADEALTHETSQQREMTNFSRGFDYIPKEIARAILGEDTPIQDQAFLMRHFSPITKFRRIKRSPESRAKPKKFKKKKSGKRKFGTKKRKQIKEKNANMKYKYPKISKHKSNKKFKEYIHKTNNEKSRNSPTKKSNVENDNTYLDSADFNEIFEMIKRKLPKIDQFWIKIKEKSDEEKGFPKNLTSVGYNSTELYSEESKRNLIGNTRAITNNSNIYFSKNVTDHDEIEKSIINPFRSTTQFKNFEENNVNSITSGRKHFYHENAVEKEKTNGLSSVKSRENFPITNSEKVSTDMRNVKEVMHTSSKNLQTTHNVSKNNNQIKLKPVENSESSINQVAENTNGLSSVKSRENFPITNSEKVSMDIKNVKEVMDTSSKNLQTMNNLSKNNHQIKLKRLENSESSINQVAEETNGLSTVKSRENFPITNSEKVSTDMRNVKEVMGTSSKNLQTMNNVSMNNDQIKLKRLENSESSINQVAEETNGLSTVKSRENFPITNSEKVSTDMRNVKEVIDTSSKNIQTTNNVSKNNNKIKLKPVENSESSINQVAENTNGLSTVKSREIFPITNSDKVSTNIRNVKEVMDTSSKNLQTTNNVSKNNDQTKLKPLENSKSSINQVARNFDNITVWKKNTRTTKFDDLNWENSSESIIHATNENIKHSETEDISTVTFQYDSNNINALHKISPSINNSGVVRQENYEEHPSEDLHKIPNSESITNNAVESDDNYFEFYKSWVYIKPQTERNLNKSSKTNIAENLDFEMTTGTFSSSDESDSFVGIHTFSENANHADLENALPEIPRKSNSDVSKKYTDTEHSYNLSVNPDNLITNKIKNDTIYKDGRYRNEEISSAKVVSSDKFYNHDESIKQETASDSINNNHVKNDFKNNSKLEEEEKNLKNGMNDEIGVITTNQYRGANETKNLPYVSKKDLFSPNKTTELRKNNLNEGDSTPELSKTHVFSDTFNTSSLFMPINFEDRQIQETSINPNLKSPPPTETHLKKSYESEEFSSSTNIIKDNNASKNPVVPDNLHVFSHNTDSFNTVPINDTYLQNDYRIFSLTDRDEIINSDTKSIDETVKKRNNLEKIATSVLPDPVFNELHDIKPLILKMSKTDNNSDRNYVEPSDTLRYELNYENSTSVRNISKIFHPYSTSMYDSVKQFNELHGIREVDILANKMPQEIENTSNKTIASKYPAIPTRQHNRNYEQINNTHFIPGTVSEVEQITNKPLDTFYGMREVIIKPTKYGKKEADTTNEFTPATHFTKFNGIIHPFKPDRKGNNTENEYTTDTHFTKSDKLISPTKPGKKETNTGNGFTTASHFKEFDRLNHSGTLNLQKAPNFDKVNNSDFGPTEVLQQIYSNVIPNDKIRNNDNTTDLMTKNSNTKQFFKSQISKIHTTTPVFNFENQENVSTQTEMYRNDSISRNSVSLHTNKTEKFPLSNIPELIDSFDKNFSDIIIFDNKLEQSNAMKNGVAVQQISEASVSTHENLYNKNPLAISKVTLSTNNEDFQGLSDNNSEEIQNNLPYQEFETELNNTTIMINSETKQNFKQPISRIFVVKEIIINSNNIVDRENETDFSSKNSTMHYDRPLVNALTITDINKDSLDAFDKHHTEPSTDNSDIDYDVRKILLPNNITKQEYNYNKVNILNNNFNQSDSLIKSKILITNVDVKEDKASTQSLDLHPVITPSMADMRKNNLITPDILHTPPITPDIFYDSGFPSDNNVTNFNKNEINTTEFSSTVFSNYEINPVINEVSLNKAIISSDDDASFPNLRSLKKGNATYAPSNKTMVEKNITINNYQSTFPIRESYQLYYGNSTFLKKTFVSTNKNNFPESSATLSSEIPNDEMASESLDNNIFNTNDIFFSEIVFSNTSEENFIAVNDSFKLENKTENENFSNIPVTVYENTFSLRTKDGSDMLSIPVTEKTTNLVSAANTSFSLSDNIRKNEDFEKENADFYKTDEDGKENTENENTLAKFAFLENKTFDYPFNIFNEATLDSRDMLKNNVSNNESKELLIKEIFPVDFPQKEIIDAQRTESNISDITRVITEIPPATYDTEVFDLKENIVHKNNKHSASFTNIHNDNSTIYTARIFTKELSDVNETKNNSFSTSRPLFLRTNVDENSRNISDANKPISFIFITNNKVTDGSENVKKRWYRLNEGNDILERNKFSVTLPNKEMGNEDRYSYISGQNNRMLPNPELRKYPKFNFFEQKNTVTEQETKPDLRKSYVGNDSFFKSNKKIDKVKYDAVFMITNNFNVKNNQARDYFHKNRHKHLKKHVFHSRSMDMNQNYFKTGDGDRYFYAKPQIEMQRSEPKQGSEGMNAEFMLKNNNDKMKIRNDIFVVPLCFANALRLGSYKFNEDGGEIDDIRQKQANQITIRITEFENNDSQPSSLSNPLENETNFRRNQFVSKKKNAYMSSGLDAKTENTIKKKRKYHFFKRYPIFQRKLNDHYGKNVNNRMGSSVNTPGNVPVFLTIYTNKMHSAHKNPLYSNNREAGRSKFYKFRQNREYDGYNPSDERYGKVLLWTNAEPRDGINIHISPSISRLSSISIEPQQLNSIPENYEVRDTHKMQTIINSDNFVPDKQRELNQGINYKTFFRQRNKRDLKKFATLENNPLVRSSKAGNRKRNFDKTLSQKINICPECLNVDENSESKMNYQGSKFLLKDKLHRNDRKDGGATISETIKKEFAENANETGDNPNFQSIILDKKDNFGPAEEQLKNQYKNAENGISHNLAGRFISFLNDKFASGIPLLASHLKDNDWTDAFRSKTLMNKDHVKNKKRTVTDEVKESQSDFMNRSQNMVSSTEMSPAENTGFDISDDESPDTIKDNEKEYDLELSDDENVSSTKDKEDEHDLELLYNENSNAMKNEEKETDVELSDSENAEIMRDKEKKQLIWKLFLPFFQSMNMTKDKKYMHQPDKYI